MDISISLSSDFEKFINEQMATGLYNSVNDIVNEAMTLLVKSKTAQQEQMDALLAELEQDENEVKDENVLDAETAVRMLMSE